MKINCTFSNFKANKIWIDPLFYLTFSLMENPICSFLKKIISVRMGENLIWNLYLFLKGTFDFRSQEFDNTQFPLIFISILKKKFMLILSGKDLIWWIFAICILFIKSTFIPQKYLIYFGFSFHWQHLKNMFCSFFNYESSYTYTKVKKENNFLKSKCNGEMCQYCFFPSSFFRNKLYPSNIAL